MGQTFEAAALLREGLRRCKTCNQVLPLDSFYKAPGKDWYDSYCLECKSKNHKAYRERNHESYKEKLRNRYHENKKHYRDLARRSLYGVPLGTYDLLLELQNGKCAICGAEKSTRSGRELAIDHDAENKTIRGLLCTPCNQGVGQFRHSVSLLHAAIEYLLRDGFTIDELNTLVGEMNKADFSTLFDEE